MSVLNDETAAMLDDLKKAIAEHETRLANGRRKSMKSDARAMALLKIMLNLLKRTLQQIEKSNVVVANSHALLEEIEENNRRRAAQARHTVARFDSSPPGQSLHL